MLAVAHRAGNTVAGLRAALTAGVDLVEADVNSGLEIRHRRAARGVLSPRLPEILAAAGPEPRLLLDLKGRSRSLAERVAETLRAEAPNAPVAVCTKQWPMLDAFAADPHIRRIYSAANRLQLARLRAHLRRARVDGVSIRLRLLTAPVVAELHRATDLVLAWPVDTEAELAHAKRLGVTGVVSKNLELLSRLSA